MKSILNDVNRLEKAWELFQRLVVAGNEFIVKPSGPAAHFRYEIILQKANAFIEKYGNDQ